MGANQVAALAAHLEAPASAGVDDWDVLRATAGDLDAAVARVTAAVATSNAAS